MGPVSFHPLAESELNDAARYYDLESPGLGSAFLDAVQKTCMSILDHPQAGAVVVGVVRRRFIRRFPYAFGIVRVNGEGHGVGSLRLRNV